MENNNRHAVIVKLNKESRKQNASPLKSTIKLKILIKRHFNDKIPCMFHVVNVNIMIVMFLLNEMYYSNEIICNLKFERVANEV